MPTAAHFIYIPGVLLVGIVIGWILGSRAAADAFAAKLRRPSRRTNSNPVFALLASHFSVRVQVHVRRFDATFPEPRLGRRAPNHEPRTSNRT